jgi:putative membrane protein
LNFLVDLIKGVFVGIANVIPGVSGGTMAVSFGIYDKLLNAISSLLKSFKKSFLTLLPIILGMVIGIVGFTYIIPWLLANFPFATSCAFTGLIIGGIPAILRSLKDGWQSEEKKSLLVNILVFLILLAVAMAMVFLNGDSESGIALTASAGMIVKIFFMGIIASATMVIPGVSGSLVLMILGYYFGVINSVKQFVEALRTLNLQESAFHPDSFCDWLCTWNLLYLQAHKLSAEAFCICDVQRNLRACSVFADFNLL